MSRRVRHRRHGGSSIAHTAIVANVRERVVHVGDLIEWHVGGLVVPSIDAPFDVVGDDSLVGALGTLDRAHAPGGQQSEHVVDLDFTTRIEVGGTATAWSPAVEERQHVVYINGTIAIDIAFTGIRIASRFLTVVRIVAWIIIPFGSVIRAVLILLFIVVVLLFIVILWIIHVGSRIGHLHGHSVE